MVRLLPDGELLTWYIITVSAAAALIYSLLKNQFPDKLKHFDRVLAHLLRGIYKALKKSLTLFHSAFSKAKAFIQDAPSVRPADNYTSSDTKYQPASSPDTSIEIQQELAALREENILLKAENEDLINKNAALRTEIANLKQAQSAATQSLQPSPETAPLTLPLQLEPPSDKRIYADVPNGKLFFRLQHQFTEYESVFVLDPETATFDLARGHDDTLRRVFTHRDSVLSVIEFQTIGEFAPQTLRTTPGKIIPEGECWRVVEKIKANW